MVMSMAIILDAARDPRFSISDRSVTCFATHDGIPTVAPAQRQRVQSLNGDSLPQMRGFPLV